MSKDRLSYHARFERAQQNKKADYESKQKLKRFLKFEAYPPLEYFPKKNNPPRKIDPKRNRPASFTIGDAVPELQAYKERLEEIEVRCREIVIACLERNPTHAERRFIGRNKEKFAVVTREFFQPPRRLDNKRAS